ncbi:uracil phosphoribosyltransferase, partial [Singulisphaera rosea]
MLGSRDAAIPKPTRNHAETRWSRPVGLGKTSTEFEEPSVSLVFPSKHPLVHHQTALLRDSRTNPPEFRRLVRGLAGLLAGEATADLALQDVQ